MTLLFRPKPFFAAKSYLNIAVSLTNLFGTTLHHLAKQRCRLYETGLLFDEIRQLDIPYLRFYLPGLSLDAKRYDSVGVHITYNNKFFLVLSICILALILS